jgi:hypothetical protein
MRARIRRLTQDKTLAPGSSPVQITEGFAPERQHYTRFLHLTALCFRGKAAVNEAAIHSQLQTASACHRA